MKVALASDHAGFELKKILLPFVEQLHHEPLDLGAYSVERSDDYPDFAEALAKAIKEGRADRGVLVCGSGVGASVAVNKVPGIRGGLCHDHYSAHQGVEHDNMNVLVLGSRVIGTELAKDLVQTFLAAAFSGEERHKRRLKKIEKIEQEFQRH